MANDFSIGDDLLAALGQIEKKRKFLSHADAVDWLFAKLDEHGQKFYETQEYQINAADIEALKAEAKASGSRPKLSINRYGIKYSMSRGNNPDGTRTLFDTYDQAAARCNEIGCDAEQGDTAIKHFDLALDQLGLSGKVSTESLTEAAGKAGLGDDEVTAIQSYLKSNNLLAMTASEYVDSIYAVIGQKRNLVGIKGQEASQIALDMLDEDKTTAAGVSQLEVMSVIATENITNKWLMSNICDYLTLVDADLSQYRPLQRAHSQYLRELNLTEVKEAIIKQHGPDDWSGVQLATDDETRFCIFLPDATEPGKVRISEFDANGFYSHATRDTYQECFDEAVASGMKKLVSGQLEKVFETRAFARGNHATTVKDRIGQNGFTFDDYVAEMARWDAANPENPEVQQDGSSPVVEQKADQAAGGQPYELDDKAAFIEKVLVGHKEKTRATMARIEDNLRRYAQGKMPEGGSLIEWLQGRKHSPIIQSELSTYINYMESVKAGDATYWNYVREWAAENWDRQHNADQSLLEEIYTRLGGRENAQAHVQEGNRHYPLLSIAFAAGMNRGAELLAADIGIPSEELLNLPQLNDVDYMVRARQLMDYHHAIGNNENSAGLIQLLDSSPELNDFDHTIMIENLRQNVEAVEPEKIIEELARHLVLPGTDGNQYANMTRSAWDQLESAAAEVAPDLKSAVADIRNAADTPDLVDGSYDYLIKIAADDIERLRKPDVMRVLDQDIAETKRAGLAAYIIDRRPDLAEEVAECLEEIKIHDAVANVEADSNEYPASDFGIDINENTELTEPAEQADQAEQAKQSDGLDRDVIAARYAEELAARSGIINKGANEFHYRFADALIAKDAYALEHLANGLNDTSKQLFTEFTGVKLDKTQAKTWQQIREWAGVSPEYDVMVKAEKKMKNERESALRKITESVITECDEIIESGFNRIEKNGSSYFLINENDREHAYNLSKRGTGLSKVRPYIEARIAYVEAKSAYEATQPAPEAPEADQIQGQDGDYDYLIKIAADDIERLRKPDVMRVLDQDIGETKRAGLAEYIIDRRPDLADEVAECLEEIKVHDAVANVDAYTNEFPPSDFDIAGADGVETEQAAADESPAAKEAWETTRDEWVRQQILQNKYASEYLANPEAYSEKANQLESAWIAELEKRAAEGRISDVALDDLVRRNGTNALSAFRGALEKGIEGYLTADARMEGKPSYERDPHKALKMLLEEGNDNLKAFSHDNKSSVATGHYYISTGENSQRYTLRYAHNRNNHQWITNLTESAEYALRAALTIANGAPVYFDPDLVLAGIERDYSGHSNNPTPDAGDSDIQPAGEGTKASKGKSAKKAQEPVNEFNPDLTFTFGKYAGETIGSVFGADPDYVNWVVQNTGKLKGAHLTTANALIEKARAEMTPEELLKETFDPEQEFTFGKHYGKTIQQVADTDMGYLRWAAGNLNGNKLFIDTIKELVKRHDQKELAFSEGMSDDEVQEYLRAEGVGYKTDGGNGYPFALRLTGLPDAIGKAKVINAIRDRFPDSSVYFDKTDKSIVVPGIAPSESTDAVRRVISALEGLKEARQKAIDAAMNKPSEELAPGKGADLVGDDVKALIRKGLDFGMKAHVVENQIEDIGRMLAAYTAEKPAFVLGNEAGTGKTFVLGGFIHEMKRQHGVDSVTVLTMNTDLIAQFKKDLSAFDIGHVNFTTYAALSNGDSTVEKGSIVLADEAHNLSNIFSNRGAEGQAIFRYAPFTVISSATPFNNPVDAQYIAATGLFEANGFSNFGDAATTFGAIEQKFGYTTTYKWGGDLEAAKAFRQWFFDRGMMTQRPMELPTHQIETDFVPVKISQKFRELYDKVDEAYAVALAGLDEENADYGNIKQHRENTLKRILEAGKLESAAEEARVAIANGRYPVIYTESRSARHLGRWRKLGADQSSELYDFAQMAEMMAEWEIDKNMARQHGGNVPPPPFARFIYDIAAAFDEVGIDTVLPPAVAHFKDALGSDMVAEYTGGVSGSKAGDELQKWRDGEKPLLVATMAKGGTGLSLHDQVGDHQTTQIIAVLPWTARILEQVLGRTARYGLVGVAEIKMLIAPELLAEKRLCNKVATRLRDMGATVKGVDHAAASQLDEAMGASIDSAAERDQVDFSPEALYRLGEISLDDYAIQKGTTAAALNAALNDAMPGIEARARGFIKYFATIDAIKEATAGMKSYQSAGQLNIKGQAALAYIDKAAAEFRNPFEGEHSLPAGIANRFGKRIEDQLIGAKKSYETSVQRFAKEAVISAANGAAIREFEAEQKEEKDAAIDLRGYEIGSKFTSPYGEDYRLDSVTEDGYVRLIHNEYKLSEQPVKVGQEEYDQIVAGHKEAIQSIRGTNKEQAESPSSSESETINKIASESNSAENDQQTDNQPVEAGSDTRIPAWLADKVPANEGDYYLSLLQIRNNHGNENLRKSSLVRLHRVLNGGKLLEVSSLQLGSLPDSNTPTFRINGDDYTIDLIELHDHSNGYLDDIEPVTVEIQADTDDMGKTKIHTYEVLESDHVIAKAEVHTETSGRPMSDDLLNMGGMIATANESCITAIEVDPQWRGLGIGKMLMDRIIQDAQRDNADILTLSNQGNEAATSMYKQYGFINSTPYTNSTGMDKVIATDSIRAAKLKDELKAHRRKELDTRFVVGVRNQIEAEFKNRSSDGVGIDQWFKVTIQDGAGKERTVLAKVGRLPHNGKDRVIDMADIKPGKIAGDRALMLSTFRIHQNNTLTDNFSPAKHDAILEYVLNDMEFPFDLKASLRVVNGDLEVRPEGFAHGIHLGSASRIVGGDVDLVTGALNRKGELEKADQFSRMVSEVLAENGFVAVRTEELDAAEVATNDPADESALPGVSTDNQQAESKADQIKDLRFFANDDVRLDKKFLRIKADIGRNRIAGADVRVIEAVEKGDTIDLFSAQDESEPGKMVIEFMSVEDGFTGSGIGTHMIRMVENEAIKAGMESVDIKATGHVGDISKIAESLGYTLIGDTYSITTWQIKDRSANVANDLPLISSIDWSGIPETKPLASQKMDAMAYELGRLLKNLTADERYFVDALGAGAILAGYGPDYKLPALDVARAIQNLRGMDATINPALALYARSYLESAPDAASDSVNKMLEQVAGQKAPAKASSAAKAINNVETNVPAESDSQAGSEPGEEADLLGDSSDSKKENRIEDTGYIPGAAKERWARFKLQFEALGTDFAQKTVAQIFPIPNYEQLVADGDMSHRGVALLAAVRAAMLERRKPRYGAARWIRETEALYQMARNIVLEPDFAEELYQKLNSEESKRELIKLAAMTRILEQLPISHIQTASTDLSINVYAERTETGIVATWNYHSKALDWSQRDYSKYRVSETPAADRIALLNEAYEKAAESRKKKGKSAAKIDLSIRHYTNNPTVFYVFYKPSGGKLVKLEQLPSELKSSSDRREWLAENRERIESQIDEAKNYQFRRSDNTPRVGTDWRGGRDIDQYELKAEFGLRDIQFGNSTLASQKEAQARINDAYDSLCDLSHILNISRKAVGLHGSLALAFGARGRGGSRPAMAHYEPGQVVINMTRKNGAGSLAHEWFHAFDNYFRKIAFDGENATDKPFDGYATASVKRLKDSNLREEVRAAFEKIYESISDNEYHEASLKLDNFRGGKAYWSQTIEKAARAFEAYVREKLHDEGMTNDYLVNLANPENAERLDTVVPTRAGLQKFGIQDAFDDCFSVLQEQETEKGILLFRNDDPMKEAARQWMEAAQNDDLFRYKDLTEPAHLLDILEREGYQATHDNTVRDAANAGWSEGDIVLPGTVTNVYCIDTPMGDTAYVYETDKEVWLDVSGLKSREGMGTEIYQIVAAHAYHSNKLFIGDPEGLSDTAVLRRTEAMLSSALRFGTAKHLAPHSIQQIARASGVNEPLEWGDDDAQNIANLVRSSYYNVLKHIPEIANVEYDFERSEFRVSGSVADPDHAAHRLAWHLNRDSQEVGGSKLGFETLLGRELPDLSRAMAGSATIKRAVITQSLISKGNAEEGRFNLADYVAELLSIAGKNDTLRGILYSNGATVTGLSKAEQVIEWIKPAEEATGVAVRVVETADDLPRKIRNNISATVKGVYDWSTGTPWIIADRIRNESDAVKTALHEGLGHKGAISFLNRNAERGGADMDALLETIYNDIGSREILKVVRGYSFDLSKSKDRREAVLEYIAHLAESGEKPRVVDQVVAGGRDLMGNVFGDLRWTRNDILNLIESSRLFVLAEQTIKAGAGLEITLEEREARREQAFRTILSNNDRLRSLLNGNAGVIGQAAIDDFVRGFDNRSLVSGLGAGKYTNGNLAAPIPGSVAPADSIPMPVQSMLHLNKPMASQPVRVIESLDQAGLHDQKLAELYGRYLEMMERALEGGDPEVISKAEELHPGEYAKAAYEQSMLTGTQFFARVIEAIKAGDTGVMAMLPESMIADAKSEAHIATMIFNRAGVVGALHTEATANGTQPVIVFDETLTDKVAVNGMAMKLAGENEIGADIGKPGLMAVNTPAFERWFKGSEVVDKQGNPQLLFVGTNRSFDEFDHSKAVAGDGLLYATNNPMVASNFAMYRSVWPGANVMPVFVNAAKMLDIDADYAEIRKTESAAELPGRLDGETVAQYAARNGYDGIVYRNTRDDATAPTTTPVADVYAFLPTAQFKSAIGNNGQFSPESNNILEKRAYHGSPFMFSRASLNHVGTGSGQNSFGWGLYFASQKEQAEMYAKSNSHQTGVVYEAEVPDTDDLLNWSLPVEQQSQSVRDGVTTALNLAQANYIETLIEQHATAQAEGLPAEGIAAMIDAAKAESWGDLSLTGAEVYQALKTRFGSDQKASEILNDAGVPGSVFITDAGDETYCIWDESVVTIDAINDQRLQAQLHAHREHQAAEIDAKRESLINQYGIHADDLKLTLAQLAERNKETMSVKISSMEPGEPTNLPLGSISVQSYGSDLGERYVTVLREVPLEGLEIAEPEGDIRKHPTFAQYVEWAKEGREAPPIHVNVGWDGQTLISANRRRTMAAIEAGHKTIKAWVSPINPETGDPLKYNDLLPVMLNNTMIVNGVERPVLNSAGKRIHPTDEGVRNFWRWHGDSKVVDAEGRPLVVYHGTENAGFAVFDPSMAGENTGRNIDGIYFTNHVWGAQTYSGTRNETNITDDYDPYNSEPGNYHVYLAMQNPAVIDFENQGWDAEVDGFYGIDEFVRYAIEAGYDGVIAKNINDEGRYGQGYGHGDTTYIVFNPEQIKSAIGNNGNFDGKNPNILFSLSAEPASPKTESAAFRKWFGNSKVVDAEGKPLVVYHGTNSDLSVFASDRANYFTGDPGAASIYAEGFGAQREGANVYPVYLSIQRPKWMPLTDSAKLTAADLAAIKEEGFDGVFGWTLDTGMGGPTPIAREVGAGQRGMDKIVTEAIPLSSEQIKSAIGNNGEFNPAMPSILARIESTADNAVPAMPNAEQPDMFGEARKARAELQGFVTDTVFYRTRDDLDMAFTASPSGRTITLSDDVEPVYLKYRAPYMTMTKEQALTMASSEQMVDALAKQGYDAIAWHMEGDATMPASRWGNDEPLVVVFDASQVASVSDAFIPEAQSITGLMFRKDDTKPAATAGYADREWYYEASNDLERAIPIPVSGPFGKAVYLAGEEGAKWDIEKPRSSRADLLNTLVAGLGMNESEALELTADNAQTVKAFTKQGEALSISDVGISYEGKPVALNTLLMIQTLRIGGAENPVDLARKLGSEPVGPGYAANIMAILEKAGATHALREIAVSIGADFIDLYHGALPGSTFGQVFRVAVNGADSVVSAEASAPFPVAAKLLAKRDAEVLADPFFTVRFGESVMRDVYGTPIVAHKLPGQHEEGPLTFTNGIGAKAYGNTTEAFLRIENPLVNAPNDPFIDVATVVDAIGADALRLAKRFEFDIYKTDQWKEVAERYDVNSVTELFRTEPAAVNSLYFPAYRLMADASEVEKMKAAGFDGAIYADRSSNAPAFVVFGQEQVIPAATHPAARSFTRNPEVAYQRTLVSALQKDGYTVHTTPTSIVLAFAEGEIELSTRVGENPKLAKAYGAEWANMKSLEVLSVTGNLDDMQNQLSKLADNLTQTGMVDVLSYGNNQSMSASSRSIVDALEYSADDNGNRFMPLSEMAQQKKFAPVRFLFAGRNANTADLTALDRAEEMESRRMATSHIWQETGWYRGVDNQWRFEVLDQDAEIRPTARNLITETVEKMRAGETVVQKLRLGDLLKHDQLYQAYPGMADIPVSIEAYNQHTYAGAMKTHKDGSHELCIVVDGNDESMGDIKRTALHEIQHLIQRAEGFAQGGNTSERSLSWLWSQSNIKLERAVNKIEYRAYMDAERDYHRYCLMQRYDRYANLASNNNITRQARDIYTASDFAPNRNRIYEECGYPPNRRNISLHRDWLQRVCISLCQKVAEEYRETTNDWRNIREDIRELKNEQGPNAIKNGMRRSLNKMDKYRSFAIAVSDANRQRNILNRLLGHTSDADKLFFETTQRTDYRGIYKANAGEAEARNTESRSLMPADELRSKSPEITLDVPESSQIVGIEGHDSDLLEWLKAREGEYGIKINVVPGIADLPMAAREVIRHSGKIPQAAIIGDDVYIVQQELKVSVAEAILHEAAHKGVRTLFGESMSATYQSFYEAIGQDAGLKAESIMAGFNMGDYFTAADRMLKAGKIDHGDRVQMLVDEFIAHAVQRQAVESLSEKARRLSLEFAGEVRNNLRNAGLLKTAEMNDADIAYILKTVHDAARGRPVDTPVIITKSTPENDLAARIAMTNSLQAVSGLTRSKAIESSMGMMAGELPVATAADIAHRDGHGYTIESLCSALMETYGKTPDMADAVGACTVSVEALESENLPHEQLVDRLMQIESIIANMAAKRGIEVAPDNMPGSNMAPPKHKEADHSASESPTI